MSGRDLQFLTKMLALFALFTSAVLAMPAGILAYDMVILSGHPISPRLFGPRIMDTPAMAWIYIQQAFALFAMAGASAVASRSEWWRVGAIMLITGGAGLAVLMVLLAHFARAAPDGSVVFAMCLGTGLPLSLVGLSVGGAVLWIERGMK